MCARTRLSQAQRIWGSIGKTPIWPFPSNIVERATVLYHLPSFLPSPSLLHSPSFLHLPSFTILSLPSFLHRPSPSFLLSFFVLPSPSFLPSFYFTFPYLLSRVCCMFIFNKQANRFWVSLSLFLLNFLSSQRTMSQRLAGEPKARPDLLLSSCINVLKFRLLYENVGGWVRKIIENRN